MTSENNLNLTQDMFLRTDKHINSCPLFIGVVDDVISPYFRPQDGEKIRWNDNYLKKLNSDVKGNACLLLA